MIKIDGKEQTFSTAFMVGDDQDVEIDAPIRDAVVRLVIRFKPGGPEQAQEGRWTTAEGVTRMEFLGWKNPLGVVTSLPQHFGDLRGEPIWFQMAHHRIGDVNVVQFYILIGGKNV